jgi:hypothetical protein
VAEEVEQVNPDLVVRDTEGKVYSVRVLPLAAGIFILIGR